jgi:GNAT superfamily N-acetyltransferase
VSASIRPVGPSDAAALAVLRRHWRLERHGIGLDADAGFESRFAGWFTAQLARGSLAWIAEAGAAPVGMLVMFVHERMPEPDRDAGRWGYVGNVFVLPAHRDAGIGGQLLDAALSHADAHGFARVVLNPSPRSVPFYERAGFSADHPLLVRE